MNVQSASNASATSSAVSSSKIAALQQRLVDTAKSLWDITVDTATMGGAGDLSDAMASLSDSDFGPKTAVDRKLSVAAQG
jgi:hypothetical protein